MVGGRRDVGRRFRSAPDPRTFSVEMPPKLGKAGLGPAAGRKAEITTFI
jgi:hypothetical protein